MKFIWKSKHNSIPAYHVCCHVAEHASRQARFKFHSLNSTTYGYTHMVNTPRSKIYSNHNDQLNLDQKLQYQTCCKLQTLVSPLVLTFDSSLVSVYGDFLQCIPMANPYGKSLQGFPMINYYRGSLQEIHMWRSHESGKSQNASDLRILYL